MGAPKPFSIATPVVATEIPAKREMPSRRVDHGPNLFLQADPANGFPDGWLAKSYDTGLWYDVLATGNFEDGVIEKGKNKGQPTTRMTGELKEVTRQIREAADVLGIGVTIKYVPQTYKSGAKTGQEIPGKWVVKYLGQNRKRSTKDTPAE